MKRSHPVIVLSLAAAASLGACSSAEDPPGTPGTAGSSNGSAGAGAPAGGSAMGGSPMGGSPTAGAPVGGTATAGGGSGGAATGGGGSGGSATAGAATGGGGSGGAGAGGSATGGSAGAAGNASGGSSGSAGAGGGDGASLSAGCGKMPTIASNMYNNGNPIPIMAANKQRRYILSVPANYDNTKPYNLVIAWHQLDGNDKQMYQQNYYWLKDIPEAASSTIFVAPNGDTSGSFAPCTGTGNGQGGCGWWDQGESNVALADAVVKAVGDSFCIDKKRIFANGWSFGGAMTYRTACSRPEGGGGDWSVRGVAIYNGSPTLSLGSCKPGKPVAMYVSHGTQDNVLKYAPGVSMATTYAKINGCMAMAPTDATGNHVCTNYMGCTAGYPVEFCSFVGPHTPDPPREGGARWQPQEVWKFLSQLPR